MNIRILLSLGLVIPLFISSCTFCMNLDDKKPLERPNQNYINRLPCELFRTISSCNLSPFGQVTHTTGESIETPAFPSYSDLYNLYLATQRNPQNPDLKRQLLQAQLLASNRR